MEAAAFYGNGKENENYRIAVDSIGDILGLYWDNGK